VLHPSVVAASCHQVPFAGYALPVQYKDSLINSHMHCRTGASLFDVSHMGQLRIWGEKRAEFLESVVVGDILNLEVNQMRLSALTTEQGGIIDDCMITKKQDHLYMVRRDTTGPQQMHCLSLSLVHPARSAAAHPSSATSSLCAR
jgi:aminomethyltransferase